MTTEQAIQIAMGHHRAGQLASAEDIYRKILAKDPNQPDALHLLGALAGQQGQTDLAIDLIRRAIALRPNYIMALKNLGAILAQANRFDESTDAYKRILELAPSDPGAHNDLGSIFLHQNRTDEALSLFSRAAIFDPVFADAYKNLSCAHRKKGSITEALNASSRALEIKPESVDVMYEHGQNLYAAGRFDEALSVFRRALSYKSDFAEADNEVGRILGEMDQLDESIAVFSKAIQRNPDRALLHFNLGNAFRKADRLEEAVTAFEAATRIKPDYFEAYANMAKVLAKLQRFDDALKFQGIAAKLVPNGALTHEAMGEIALVRLDAEEAVESYRRACAADPQSLNAHIGLGTALQSQGKFDEAQASFRKAMELRPDQVGIYQTLTRSGKLVADEQDIKRLSDALSCDDIPATERCAAEFAMGKILDEKRSFDAAFDHYTRANKIVRELRALAGDRYEPQEVRRSVDQMVETLTPHFFAERRGWGERSTLPVFIVGMPRSGTTLIHQIAASHPDVHGIGESSNIANIGKSLGGNDARSAALGWRPDTIGMAAAQLITQYQSLSNTALRIVDKQPGNVFVLGLIPLLFPEARIIFCRRDPRDICLSCYFQNFDRGNSFAFDLVHCGLHQVQIDRILDHCIHVLPLQILEVSYEAVVADLEGEARRLIDFLGLSWNPACLDFPQASTAVLTASVWQVRQPIYDRSVGRWRHYERHLAPLFQALAGTPAMRGSGRLGNL